MDMKHLWWICAVVGLSGTAMVTPAAGAVEVVGTAQYAPAQGPVIAGSRLAYVPSAQPSAGEVRIDGAADGHTQQLGRVPAEPMRTDGGTFTSRSLGATVAASASTLVATVTTNFDLAHGRSGDPGQDLQRTWAGPLGGQLSPVSAACEYPNILDELSVDGDRLSTEGTTCGTLSILDRAAGTQQPLAVNAKASVQIAGPITAWLEADDPVSPQGGAAVVVDDRGTKLLRVPIGLVFGYVRLTVDQDGSLALFGRLDPSSSKPDQIVVASPAHPTPQAVPLPKGAVAYGARLAHGRLAILQVRDGRSPAIDGEIVVMNPDGSDRHTVLRGVAAYGQDAFAFDGDHLAAVVNDCDKALLVRASADSRASDALAPRHCALSLLRHPRWSAAGISIATSCRGFRAACTIRQVTVRIGGPGGELLGRRASTRKTTFSVPVSRELRRRLRGTATRIWLSARIGDASHIDQSRARIVNLPPRR